MADLKERPSISTRPNEGMSKSPVGDTVRE